MKPSTEDSSADVTERLFGCMMRDVYQDSQQADLLYLASLPFCEVAFDKVCCTT